MAKLTWFKSRDGNCKQISGVNWKTKIPEGWKGKDMSQRCVPGMKFTTLIQVPNTKDSVPHSDLIL